jgi:TatD DNase family protein
VYSTVGIHPCSSAIFGTAPKHHPPPADSPCAPAPGGERTDMPDAARTRAAIAELRTILSSSPPGVVAFGEFGLDYDRLFWCSRAVQLHSFHAQLALVAGMPPGAQLPLFLHSRAAHVDFVALMKEAFGERLERLERGGVVHSFTGTMDEMRELAALGLYVGVNGCSLKTDENCAVVREIPLDRLMLETDGPWCEVRSSHAGWKYLLPAAAADAEEQHPPTPAEAAAPPNARRSRKKNNPPPAPRPEERFKSVKKEKWEPGAMVRGRNEPCMVERVAAIVAAIKGVSVEEVCEAAWANTVRVFGLGER